MRIALLANLPDSSLTADSFYENSPLHAPSRSRLYTQHEPGVGYGGWATDDLQGSPWVQADLLEAFHVSAVATQGRDAESHDEWVTEYSLSYGSTSASLQPVVDVEGNTVSFAANSDRDSTVRHEFATVRAQVVRLHVLQYFNHAALRWEVYGCITSKNHQVFISTIKYFTLLNQLQVRNIKYLCQRSNISHY